MNTTAMPGHAHDAAAQSARSQFSMWVFLASEMLLFGGLLLAYGISRYHWPLGFAAASAHTQLGLGTANTAILLTSSLVVALAAQATSAGLQTLARRWLLIAAVLGVLFLLLKGIECRREWDEGLFPGPAFRLDPSIGDGQAAP